MNKNMQAGNIAASELLLPGHHFIDSLYEYGFSLSSVVPLSERFRASKTAIIIKMVSSGKRVCVPDDSCVYVAVGTNEVTNGREDWGIPGHPVYEVEAMYLPPLDDNDLTPRAVALLMPA